MRRLALALASAAFVAACVDLFHDTDFTTLCSDNPDACASTADATTDAPVVTDIPLLDFCVWSSAEARAKAEHTCAWLGACEGASAGSTYGLCMTRALEAYDCRFNPGLRPAGATHVLWSCLGALPTATTCADVSRCLHGPTPPTCSGVSNGGGTFTACAPTGETVLSCALPQSGSPPVASESCTLEGRRCGDAGACVGVKGTRCANNDTCDGTNAVRCRTQNDSNDVGLDCALRGGGACVVTDAGVACAPIADAGACDAGATVRCEDGGVAHSCVGGRDVVLDCAAVNRTCAATSDPLDPAASCIRPDAGGCSDDPAAPTETCEEGVIGSCARGELYTLDCARAGLKNGCEVPVPPYIRRARCVKP